MFFEKVDFFEKMDFKIPFFSQKQLEKTGRQLGILVYFKNN